MVEGRVPDVAAARPSTPAVLVGAAHLGPTLAVTVLAGLLAVAQGLPADRTALLVAAVLAGQLSIGWCNDLVDQARDAEVRRRDKPLIAGPGSVATVRIACGAAVVATVVLSLALGLAAGLVHLGCVACAWAYNLGLKSTVWSWAPYALAFGGLTGVVALADGELPPWWWPVGAALLGVGAHLVNTLPDLDEDRATGVHGLPHALGAARIPVVAAAVFALATAVVLLGARPGAAVGVSVALVVLVLVALVLRGRGRVPFAAAVAVALVDAALLVAAR